MKVIRENQGGPSFTVCLQGLYISAINSHRCSWGDWLGKDDPAYTISLRGRLL